jgi:hypothetical protein
MASLPQRLVLSVRVECQSLMTTALLSFGSYHVCLAQVMAG